MAMTVNVHEAKTQLSKLLALVEAGEDVVIARNGKAVARISAYEAPPERRFGTLNIPAIPDSVFFDPMTEEELAEWE